MKSLLRKLGSDTNASPLDYFAKNKKMIGATHCTINDQRSEDQKLTHTCAVLAQDNYLSGWGDAEGGISRCAWAFDSAQVDPQIVLNHIQSRSDMEDVELVEINDYTPPSNTAHFTIYVCNPGHRYSK